MPGDDASATPAGGSAPAGTAAPGRSATVDNLPIELTTFVGRHNELAETRRLLRTARLVTLTGIGGVGKTRLALRAAEKVRGSFPGGVWLVELGELSDASLLVNVVAGTLGVLAPADKPLEDALVDKLADADCLLVLDNCEQIVDAVAALCDRVLRRCRRVHILCTSREALRAAGEVLLRVPPLAVPGDADEITPAGLVESDAVALFVERASAAARGFVLTDGVAGDVADICRRLDGLPLAIELAAARLRTLSPSQILERLADRFALLTHSGRGAPTRQQTLRLCMDWSHELCSPAEQRVWSRVAFFAGSMDMEAAAAICGADGLLDIVTSLIEKSILMREDSDAAPARFRMLETLREYGQEKAREQGHADEVVERLTLWYCDLAGTAHDEWIGPRQLEWIARLERELPNFRDVLDRCALQDPQRGLRTAVALFPFWNARGLFSEGRYWLDRMLAQDDGMVSVELATGIFADCVLTASQGDLEAALALVARARATGTASADPLVHGIVALTDGIAALFSAEVDRARALLEVAVAVLGGPGTEEILHLSALTMLAFAYELGSDSERAGRCFEQALDITAARGESVFRSYLLWGTGVSLWRSGRGEDAAVRLKEGLRVADDVGHPLVAAVCLEALAWIAAGDRDSSRAAALLGAADALSHRTDSVPTFLPALLVHHREAEQGIREAVGKRTFSRAYRTGAELAASGDMRSLLEPAAPPPRVAASPTPALTTPADPRANPLTRRELEVAALIGRGLTNRAIARELVISQRTVSGHVERILAKLNLSSRVQVAAWVVRHQSVP
ncbi:LuxR C-terminal-related transcriptional regulator [Pseudonocardia alaniniphila]|uniref:LuxR C-terminal-related transcriptional regulator n=1 Tax=Pseudonocardia alaniniphila TaxID=75291 RepID=A0ABS9TTH0_9PSEU|nr:LuxR C-terminal-related transcriptional regulator [Pseudonocardia alaniniphila]MCH6171791.1 LuxR C-terminal-related transcriptional regulator [Pseudonocardia alaniniphila]